MTEIDLERALQFAQAAAYEVSPNLKEHFGRVEPETKSDTGSHVTDVVTRLDRETEEVLAERLGTFSADVGFRGEEGGIREESDTTWLVDPIDGTSHYVRGTPFCTTMISLIEEGRVVAAVINDFVRDEMYSARLGAGASMNGQPISVSNRPIEHALVVMETHLEVPENYSKYLAVRDQAGMIATLNCGFEFAMVASGKLEARIGYDPYGKDWDFAPGSLLVSESGGRVTNIGSRGYDYQNHDYVIGNQLVHAALTEGPDAIFPIQETV